MMGKMYYNFKGNAGNQKQLGKKTHYRLNSMFETTVENVNEFLNIPNIIREQKN